jgi:asparagine synthase (glutamine-hydrolysing)
MFAFALYDAALRRLFLARDRAGEKPLYFCRRNRQFTFSSELQALFKDPGIERRIDGKSLHSYLAYGYAMGSTTMVKGVEKLPPGCALTYEVDTGKVHQWRYWEPPSLASYTSTNDEDLIEQIDELLKESVRMRMVADVPIGLMLSGGLDSSLVTAFAAEATSKPVKTFTVAFPGHTVDESRHARLVARHFGTEHHQLVAESTSMDLLPYLAERSGEPIADYSMIPMYQLSKVTRQHVTVALGGDGGDELFGGYPHYNWLQVIQTLHAYVPSMGWPIVHALAEKLPVGLRGRQHLLGISKNLDDSLTSINQLFDSKTRLKLLDTQECSNGFSPEKFKREFVNSKQTVLRKASLLDFQTYLVDDILAKIDRASMLNSLEVRAPFLDHRLVELTFRTLPDSLRATRTKRKILLKRLGKLHLPHTIDIERKQGFVLPLSAWFADSWGPFVRDVLQSDQQTLFNKRTIASLITGQRFGLSNGPRLYALTMFELWRRHQKLSY